MNRCVLALVIAFVPFGVAHARSEDGTLSMIRVPNNGQPAIVVRGESFTVRAQGQPDIFVDRDAQLIELTANWRPLQAGQYEATVLVPAAFEPGLYTLVGILDEVEDTQHRALLVLRDVPVRYYAAHIASPGIEAEQEASLKDAFRSDDALLAIVSGNLTANGEADEFRTLLDWLNTSSIATVVVPGPHDSAQAQFGNYFDPAPRVITCGRDAFLTIGETAPIVGEDALSDAGLYQSLRQMIKPARWSIGISGYAPAAFSPRMQIVLFVDTPLHALVTARVEHPNGEPPVVNWDSFQGATRIVAPALDQPVGIHWIHIAPFGVVTGTSPEENQP